MSKIITNEQRTARTEKRCENCYGTIEAGERYHHSFIVDGIGYSWNSHLFCYEVSEFFVAEVFEYWQMEDGIPPLADWVHEYMDEKVFPAKEACRIIATMPEPLPAWADAT